MSPALISFLLYMAAVFGLAVVSARYMKGKTFLNEYFLGSRSFGVWAVAMTFAATNASGGSFVGFPSLIYTHGWVLALWIAGFMIAPLMAMALLGKRLNHVSRKVNAVTIPEVLRERFGSRAVGACASLVLVFFMFFYLLAQFKAGAKILGTLLADVEAFHTSVRWMARVTEGVPWVGNSDPEYLLCLLVFGIVVVAYVSYGGFRAVVWTDVMQGIIMFFGVVVMLGLALSQAGGLANVTKRMAEMTPPEEVVVSALPPEGTEVEDPGARNVELRPKGSWPAGTFFNAVDERGADAGVVRLKSAMPQFSIGEPQVGAPEVDALRLTDPESILLARESIPDFRQRVRILSADSYAYGAGQPGVYTVPPGPHISSVSGFLSLTVAISFFFFWPFGGAGQPGNMVRLMVFKNTAVFRRSIITVSIYYSIIYFGLVLVFCAARVLMPGMEVDSDRVMPEFAALLSEAAGWPWLAGLLVAAPFAAVMSSVDSFLLIVSSALVRDIYQCQINPQASERRIRWFSYTATALVGAGAILSMVNPPQYLQVIIIFASGGLAACFFVPVLLALYWPRMTAAGVIASMAGGAFVHLALYAAGYAQTGTFTAYALLGMDALIWDIAGALLIGFAVSLGTSAPPRNLVEKFFAG